MIFLYKYPNLSFRYFSLCPDAQAAKNEKLQKLVNKTKETVSELTERMHSTWHSVKNLSTHLVSSSPAVSTLHEKVLNVASKVNPKWNTARNKMENGWFHKKTNFRKDDSRWAYFSLLAYTVYAFSHFQHNAYQFMVHIEQIEVTY